MCGDVLGELIIYGPLIAGAGRKVGGVESQFENPHPHQLVSRYRSDAVRYLSLEVALPRDCSKCPFMRPE